MDNLGLLLSRFDTHPVVHAVINRLNQDKPPVRMQVTGLTGALESFVMAAVARNYRPGQGNIHLIIANDKEEAAFRLNDLEGMMGKSNVFFFPDSFKKPRSFDVLNQTQILQRSETISKITMQSGVSVVVTYPEALFEKVVKPEVVQQNLIQVRKGEKLDVDYMIEILVTYGFERADFVYEPGQFSVRGGIIDLFSFGNDLPYRIELFDEEVETLRTFDPTTQLSIQQLGELRIVPNLNTQFKRDEKASLLEVLPDTALIWVRDLEFMIERLQLCFDESEKYASRVSVLDSAELREIFRDRAFVFPGHILEDLFNHPLLFVDGDMNQIRKNRPALFSAP